MEHAGHDSNFSSLFTKAYVAAMMQKYPIRSTAMVWSYFVAYTKRVGFIFRSQNMRRPTTKGYDLYFGTKIPFAEGGTYGPPSLTFFCFELFDWFVSSLSAICFPFKENYWESPICSSDWNISQKQLFCRMWKLARDPKVGPLDCNRSALHTEHNFIFCPL